MANGIRTRDPRGFNKGRRSTFRVGFQVRQTPEGGWRTYRQKRYGNSNKDEDNSPLTINEKKLYGAYQTLRKETFWLIFGRLGNLLDVTCWSRVERGTAVDIWKREETPSPLSEGTGIRRWGSKESNREWNSLLKIN